MLYFSFLQYVMRFCCGTSRATDDGGIIKVSLVSKQYLSPLSLATDSASRQRRSRRRLAAFTSTQGSRKMSRPLASLQNCEKTVREKSKPRRGRRPIGAQSYKRTGRGRRLDAPEKQKNLCKSSASVGTRASLRSE